jgi:rhodanese-related sulfurtransferase
MYNISKEEWKKRISEDDNAVILDVRTPEEWSEGVMPETLKIDIMASDFMEKVNELDKSKSYYVYCRSGGRSGQACNVLDSLGCDAAFNLIGGVMSWDEELV